MSLAGSSDEGTVGYGGATITSEVDSAVGLAVDLLVRPSLRMTNDLELFARVGYVATEFIATRPSRTASADGSSFA